MWSTTLFERGREELSGSRAPISRVLAGTREDFIIRLKKTALSIPPADVSKVIGDLARRCELLYRAKGGLFEESEEL